ncbi:MAG: MATE family efflux transporter, partial [Mariprofundaceae bacterium]|nr:MATE family efflux transporter [Mariprofundaceae bacterium]
GLAFLYGLSLVLSNMIITFWVYGTQRDLIPKISLYHPEFVRPIMSLGAKFFIIQIAVVVIFTTDKILITQLFGPEHVTQYDVVFKLFSMIAIAHGILMAPLWSSYADAYHRGDIDWIRTMMQRQLKMMVIFFALTILLMLVSFQLIALWIGNDFNVDAMLVKMMTLFIIISTWNNVFAFFLNAINEVRIQMYTSVLALIINIPLSIFIVKYFDTGVYGIIIGTVISLSLFAIAGPIQTFNVLKGKA